MLMRARDRDAAVLDAVAEAEAVTEVRRVEAALKTGALQKAILNSANFSSIATDEKGVIQLFNVGAERMLGYAAAEVVNRITADDIYELTYIRKDGSRFPAIVSVTALRDAQETIIGYLLIGTDNSARKRIEEQLRWTEESFRLMVESVTDCAIVMLDPQGCVVSWNAGAQRIIGYSAEEIVDQHLSRFYLDADVESCLLYTSDAADERSSVDLG